MAGRRHHAGPESTSTNRSFPVTVAIASLLYSLLAALSCAYLPDDPLYIGLSIQYYASTGGLLSVLGLIGIVTKNYALTIAFALFLLLDAFASAIVRLIVLQFFFEAFYDYNVCASSYDPTWSSRNFRHDIVTSVRYQKEHIWQATHQKTCRVALGAVQVVLVGVLVCLTAAQGSLALTMRRFAKELVRNKSERSQKVPPVAMRRSMVEKPRRSRETSPSSPHDETCRMAVA